MSSVVALLRRPVAGFVLDIVLVIVFAAIGRANHGEGNAVGGALETAWPFLVGVVVGWGVVRSLRKSWPLEVGPGITVWFATLVFGMLLRRVAGQGTALSFVVVAAVTLAVFLVGWRAVVEWRLRRTSNTP